jgi:hypothetical protein
MVGMAQHGTYYIILHPERLVSAGLLDSSVLYCMQITYMKGVQWLELQWCYVGCCRLGTARVIGLCNRV